MLEQYIQLGQRIELESVTRIVTDGKTQQLKKVYSSKVYDVISEERLEILMPYEQRKLILLPVDSEYNLYFYTDNGVFECRAKITDRYKSNNVFILVVELLTPLKKKQRREYYRYNCAIAIETCILNEEEQQLWQKEAVEPGADRIQQNGIIIDLSGGGLRFVSNCQYAPGDVLFCRYSLLWRDREKKYEVLSKVLNVQPAEKRPGYFEYRIQYQDMENRKREEIIQYIFEEERKSRKKEKGM